MISLVIPVYNEGENILELLAKIKNIIPEDNEINIIYDFENDTTLSVINKNYDIKNQFNINLLKNDINPGVAGAIKKGLQSSKGNYILVLMADLSDEFSDIPKMLKKMDEGYDIVCGSRYMKGGKQIGGGVLKTFLSKFAGKTLRFLSRIPTSDASNNFKLYKKSVIDNINIEGTISAAIALEITVKAFKKGYKIAEIPTIWRERKKGKSNFKLFKWIPIYLKWYFYCIFKIPFK